MPSMPFDRRAANHWDLSAAIDLVDQLYIPGSPVSRPPRIDPHIVPEVRSPYVETDSLACTSSHADIRPHGESSGSTLGDFERLWRYLAAANDRGPDDQGSGDLHYRRKPGNPRRSCRAPSQAGLSSEYVENARAYTPTSQSEEQDKVGSVTAAPAPALKPSQEQSAASTTTAEQRRELIQRLTRSSRVRGHADQSLREGTDLRSLSGSELQKKRSGRKGCLASPTTGHLSEPEHSRAVVGRLGSTNGLGASIAKKQKLMSLLHDRFKEDRVHLKTLSLPPPTPPTAKSDSLPAVHVFVDLSNVLIGFMNMSSSTSMSSRRSLYNQKLFSFHNLALVLERGRPIAKRIIAGSDRIVQIAEAEALKYQACILDRVYKARQVRSPPAQRLSKRQTGDTALTSARGFTSTAAESPKKSVEQGVDEVLHLKMAQSILDADQPATIVLASGDAAEAEYSDGFLKMLERALLRGWKVELVAFKSNVSSAYRTRLWRKRWGAAFSIIELDEFAEVLLND